MRTKELLKKLFCVLGEETKDYFISGSLSFLPLLNYYRKPGKDIDVSINNKVFNDKKNLFKKLGKYHVLNLQEVAVANTSVMSKLISLKTGFIHIDIDDGLLDISLYKEKKDTIELMFGMSFTLEVTKEILNRRKPLTYEGIKYYSAPIEAMFITKSVEYVQSIEKGNSEEYKKSKHYEDIYKMSAIIDWHFAELFLNSLKVKWMGKYLPSKIENKINPCRKLNIKKLKAMF